MTIKIFKPWKYLSIELQKSLKKKNELLWNSVSQRLSSVPKKLIFVFVAPDSGLISL